MKVGTRMYRTYKASGDGRDPAELRRVPQRPICVCEIVSYAILPFLLIMAGAMPTAALPVLPAALVMLYLLFRRFGIYLPVACTVVYGAAALWLNYDILTVIYSVALLFALVGLCVSAQCKAYLACAATAAIFAIAGAMSGVAVVRIAESKPIADIAAGYVISERDDRIIDYFARDYYDNGVKLNVGEQKLKPSDEGYKDATIGFLADWASDEYGEYIWYYCIHYAAVAAGIGFFFSIALNRKTSSCRDADATEADLRKSTRALGGVRVLRTPVAQMKMPRSYLWTCVLPAMITGLALQFVGGYSALAATCTHLFVTMPSAFTFITVATYFATLFKGKARVAAYIVLGALAMLTVVFSAALFFFSVIGVCDCILDLRYWTEFIKKL